MTMFREDLKRKYLNNMILKSEGNITPPPPPEEITSLHANKTVGSLKQMFLF